MAVLDLSALVNRWPGALYTAFVFATAEQPDVTSAASPAVQRVPPPALAGGGLSWRKGTAYALFRCASKHHGTRLAAGHPCAR